MLSGQAIELIGNLLLGGISVAEFAQQLDEYLFVLRQNPEMTQEKAVLSQLEHVLHEISEGDRHEIDLYAYAEAVLSRVISIREAPSPAEFSISPIRTMPHIQTPEATSDSYPGSSAERRLVLVTT